MPELTVEDLRVLRGAVRRQHEIESWKSTGGGIVLSDLECDKMIDSLLPQTIHAYVKSAKDIYRV